MDQNYFVTPFASLGDQTVIPIPTDSGGAVSMQQGWGPDYQRDQSSDPLAKPIDRATTNWLLFVATQAISALQRTGIPEWITPANNSGTPLAYAKYAQVRYSATTPGVTFETYVSTVDGNTSVPGADANWQPIASIVAAAADVIAGTSARLPVTPLTLKSYPGNAAQTFSVATGTLPTHAAQVGQLQAGGPTYAVATGTANAHVVALTPALVGPRVDGMVIRYKSPGANTGALTLNDGIGTVAVVGGAHSALQGGETAPNGDVWVQWNSSIGGGSYVMLDSSGGALQITPGVASQHAARLDQIGHGQCLLSATSATQLTLKPLNGNNLIINGVPQQIPSAGVTLANTGLVALTAYYIYAYMASGVMTLEASATGHSTNTNGVEIKTGDATRTLVGLVYTNGSSQFISSTTVRYVLNWFPSARRTLPLALSGSVGAFTNTGAVVEVDTSKRLFFINWADEGIALNLSGQCVNSTSGFDVIVTGGLDNGTVVTNQSGGTISTGGYGMSFACATMINASEGVPHILQLLARVGGGSGTLVGLGMSVSLRG